ncbi:MAG: hypothetical protein Q8O41_11705 [Candidatus Methanoperedens sp.]|nr:hypothetical protein [Candidatus Methanoperedens sp.]
MNKKIDKSIKNIKLFINYSCFYGSLLDSRFRSPRWGPGIGGLDDEPDFCAFLIKQIEKEKEEKEEVRRWPVSRI